MPEYNPNNCPLVAEYMKLKEEQLARIGLRDNLIFVTLGAFGGLMSFALVDEVHLYTVLVVPWVSTVLGWTYLMNDEKVSAIGRYLREELAKKIDGAYPEHSPYLQWEHLHRTGDGRKRRKLAQLMVDELTFGGTSIASIAAFVALVGVQSNMLFGAVVVDAAIAGWMIVEIALHADTGTQ